MSGEIAVALISTAGSILVGGLAFLGVVITNKKSNKDVEQKLVVAQAVTNAKIEELTREVREHNNFARRMPVVENEIHHIEDDIKTLKKFHTGGTKNA